MNRPYRIAVIGGGAAGFFAAITAKSSHPTTEVIVLEKSANVLSKVKVSGGGRCNVTNNCFDTDLLAKNYPRGASFLRKAFQQFAVKETIEWFESRNVPLQAFPDNRIFPKSNTSQTIIECLLKEAYSLKIPIQLQTAVTSIQKEDKQFILETSKGTLRFDSIIVAVGGMPKSSNMVWLETIGCQMVPPVPSLFTFNMPKNPIIELMGSSVERVSARVEKEKLDTNGALLITHWGMSGPAVLKLSAWGARTLAEKNYQFNLLVNWTAEKKEDEVRALITSFANGDNAAKKVTSIQPFLLPKRIWLFICKKANLSEEMRWADLGKKSINQLVNQLVNDAYPVSGKTTFKEEFVTAGGVALSEVNVHTMEHKNIPSLFFAGEALDIDGITGGFNFQAAWTTGYIAGKNAFRESKENI